MSKWRGFVARVMGLAAMSEAMKTDGILVAARMPRVAETPKPRPAGMATEFQRNIKPPTKGKGTRKQRRESSRRLARYEIALKCRYHHEMEFKHIKERILTGDPPVIRYGSKAHRRALAKLTQ
jgi:hypothetical protein